MPEHYKLTYFNARGRAEPIRLIFAAAGQSYEEHRIEMKDWGDFKPHTPAGVLPYLEVSEEQRLNSAFRDPSAIRKEYNVNNFVLSQSAAIARYLSRKFNLAGQNDREHAEVDQYVDQSIDAINEMIKLRRSKAQGPEKDAEQNKFEQETIPKLFGMFEQRLHHTGLDHLVPSGITVADLYLFSVVEWLGSRQDVILANYPGIERVVEMVRNYGHIPSYLAKRPYTDF